MKLSTFEKYMIASPVLVNLVLPFVLMQIDHYLEAYTLYAILALLVMTLYPVFPAIILKKITSLGLYLTAHTVTVLIAVYVIYNDSALIYLYASLGIFALTAGIALLFRKKSTLN